jgi:hypothetical protein
MEKNVEGAETNSTNSQTHTPGPDASFSKKKKAARGGDGNFDSGRLEGSVKLSVKEVQDLLCREDSGPGRAYSHYLSMPSDQRLERLVKAVLSAKKLETSEWESYQEVVLEASAREDA